MSAFGPSGDQTFRLVGTIDGSPRGRPRSQGLPDDADLQTTVAGFRCRAGDENRTRVFSLGSSPAAVSAHPPGFVEYHPGPESPVSVWDVGDGLSTWSRRGPSRSAASCATNVQHREGLSTRRTPEQGAQREGHFVGSAANLCRVQAAVAGLRLIEPPSDVSLDGPEVVLYQLEHQLDPWVRLASCRRPIISRCRPTR